MIPLKALAVLCSRTVEGRSGDRPWRGSKAATCQVTRGALIGRTGAARLILRAPIDKSSAAPVLLLLLIQPASPVSALVSQYFPLSPLLFLNSQLRLYTGLRTTFTSSVLFFLLYIFLPRRCCVCVILFSLPVTRKISPSIFSFNLSSRLLFFLSLFLVELRHAHIGATASFGWTEQEVYLWSCGMLMRFLHSPHRWRLCPLLGPFWYASPLSGTRG